MKAFVLLAIFALLKTAAGLRGANANKYRTLEEESNSLPAKMTMMMEKASMMNKKASGRMSKKMKKSSGGNYDICQGAIGPLEMGSTVAGSTVEASVDDVDPCGSVYHFNDTAFNGVWYSVLGTGNLITASTCDGDTFSFDTQVSVFVGDCDALVCVDGNDDFCGLHSSVTFPAEYGELYYILVHGFHTASGNFSLSVTEASVPDNDLCSAATELAVNGPSFEGSTLYATFDDVDICGSVDHQSPGVWTTVVGTGNPITATTCSFADFDTQVTVFYGSCDELVCVDGNDDSCGLQSTVTWLAEDQVVYYILVHGYSVNSGDFELELFETALPAGP